ncbi:hypothetical protein ACFYOK_11440 [Microbispora bryophytorum]|uniref:hypothetical protein n=1 Tax=Microbispora bryophytorum TaxID=1460882 RepID=UPI0033FAFB6E
MVDQVLLAGGLIVGPLFTLTYLAEGAARAHYKPLRHPVSCLTLGERGACFVFAWPGTRGWAIYSVASGVLFAATMALAAAAFAQKERLVAVGGLIQRVSVTIAWAWLAVLAVHTLGA